MGGESERDKQAKALQASLGGYQNEVRGLKTDVANRWNNWKPEFGYAEMKNQLNQILSNNMGQVNRQANLGIQQGTSDLAERMAGEGMASSSITESNTQRIRDKANRNRSELLAQLFGQNMQGNLGAMGEANKYDFMGNQQATGVDQFNSDQLMRKYGLLSGAYGQQLGNIQNFSPDTWLTDVFAGINAGANVIDAFNLG